MKLLKHSTSTKHRQVSTLQELRAKFTLYITHSEVMKSQTEGSDGSFGFSMEAGDWNKDGHKDLAISAPWDKNGKVIIKWGPLPLTYLNSNMLSVRTTTIIYSYPTKLFGYMVKNACNLNDDGIDDLIITSPDKDGMVFYLFGSRALSATSIFDFMNITKGKGGIIYGIAGSSQELGWSVASCKDLDNDGRADFIVSAPSVTTRTTTGAVYIATKVYNYSLYTNIISLPNITSATRNNFGFALEVVENTPNTGEFSIVSSALQENDYDGAVYVIPIKNISTTINLYSPDVWHIVAPYGSYMELGYSLSVYRNKIAIGAIGYNDEDGAVFIINADDFGKNLDFSKLVNYTGIPGSIGRFGNSIIFNEYGILIGIYYLNFNSGGLAWFFKEESTSILNLQGTNGFMISGSRLGRSHFGLSMLTVSGISINNNWPVLFASAPSLYNWDGALGLIPPSCCYKELTGFCLPCLDGLFTAVNKTEITLQRLKPTATASDSETYTYSFSENQTSTPTHSSSDSLTISNTKNSPSHTSTLSNNASETITESYTKNASHSLSLTQTASTTLSPTKNSPSNTRTLSTSSSKTITQSYTKNISHSLSLTQTASTTLSTSKNSPSYTPTTSSTNIPTITKPYIKTTTSSLSNSLTSTPTLSSIGNGLSATNTNSFTHTEHHDRFNIKTATQTHRKKQTDSYISSSSKPTLYAPLTKSPANNAHNLLITQSISAGSLSNNNSLIKKTTISSAIIIASKTNYVYHGNLDTTPTISSENLERPQINPELKPSSWSTSSIIGIVVGVVAGTIVFIGAVAGITYFWCYKCRSKVVNAARINDLFQDSSPKGIQDSFLSLLRSSGRKHPSTKYKFNSPTLPLPRIVFDDPPPTTNPLSSILRTSLPLQMSSSSFEINRKPDVASEQKQKLKKLEEMYKFSSHSDQVVLGMSSNCPPKPPAPPPKHLLQNLSPLQEQTQPQPDPLFPLVADQQDVPKHALHEQSSMPFQCLEDSLSSSQNLVPTQTGIPSVATTPNSLHLPPSSPLDSNSQAILNMIPSAPPHPPIELLQDSSAQTQSQPVTIIVNIGDVLKDEATSCDLSKSTMSLLGSTNEPNS